MPRWNKPIPEEIVPAHTVEVAVHKIGIDYGSETMYVEANTGFHTFLYENLPPQVQNWFDNAVARAETVLELDPNNRINEAQPMIKGVKRNGRKKLRRSRQSD